MLDSYASHRLEIANRVTFLLRGLLLGLTRLLVGARADWQGCAPMRQQRIYYANHSSHLDTAVIVAALPTQTVVTGNKSLNAIGATDTLTASLEDNSSPVKLLRGRVKWYSTNTAVRDSGCETRTPCGASSAGATT